MKAKKQERLISDAYERPEVTEGFSATSATTKQTAETLPITLRGDCEFAA